MPPVSNSDPEAGCSSSSSNLNHNAKEFVPLTNQNEQASTTMNEENSKTGAIPKFFNNRRNNNQKFYDSNRNWQNRNNNYEDENGKKFYRNNNNRYSRYQNENSQRQQQAEVENNENIKYDQEGELNDKKYFRSNNNYNNNRSSYSRTKSSSQNFRSESQQLQQQQAEVENSEIIKYGNDTEGELTDNKYFRSNKNYNHNNRSSYSRTKSSSQNFRSESQQLQQQQAEVESNENIGYYDERPNSNRSQSSNNRRNGNQRNKFQGANRGERQHDNEREDLESNENANNRHRQRKPAERKQLKKVNSSSQRDRLTKEIENNSLECMICCEKIKTFQSIWSCTNCFQIQHLHCIKTWMKNSKDDQGKWRCPACNGSSSHKPNEYLCFCGKMKNPTVNRNDLAHSCGDMCLSTQNCLHPCQLKCHPGPHQVCHASVMKFCACGKTSKTYQCSMKALFECESTCDKILNCRIHKCLKQCHQGECDECKQEIECTCYCGIENKMLPCTAENFDKVKYSCEKKCQKTLSCGNHTCNEICHEGICKPCKLLPEYVRSCPCGKMPIKLGTRSSCKDEIPICDGKCEKTLQCGKLSQPHRCESKCHLGDCQPCNQTSSVKCRCGRKEEKIPCKDLINSDLRCKKKCNKFKNCGRHKCQIECCIDPYHVCTQNCNRLLNCNKHKCQRQCHVGNCSPCPRMSFDELRCECDATVIYPPVPCGVTIQECKNKCKRKHKCDHPVNHNCHSEPNCPPCVFLSKKFCHGKHEERKTIPCNQESFSCGKPCAKLLKCGRHTCIKTCHQGDCEKSGELCAQKCTVKRNECEHNCNAKCHDGECPDNLPCREKVQVNCQCGNLKTMKTCEQVEYENRKLQRVHIQQQMQGSQSDGINDLKSLLNDFKKTTKILECNDECKTLERNRRLDIAFKVINPTLATTPKFIPVYSEHVRNYYKKDSSFVNMVHEKLTELVKLAKESKAAYRCHSFPSMNRDKRHVIHDMAELFGVETQAFDAEPNRNIVATATRETCWLPSMSVAEVANRENGFRRPPTNFIFKK